MSVDPVPAVIRVIDFLEASGTADAVLGIAPTRDGAVVGFTANTAIADGTSLYLRYEGYHGCRHHFRPW